MSGVALAVLLGGVGEVAAQTTESYDVRAEVFAGGEIERYLRNLQLARAANWYPWTVRAFSPGEVEGMARPDSTHPWGERFRITDGENGLVEYGWVRPRAGAIFNSAFPYGGNDGAVWSGRGITTAVEGGAWARVGPLSLVLAPVAFIAQNREFELHPASLSGERRFNDAREGGSGIDLPQRFGEGSYSRISPGQSTVRLDLGPVAVAASTANQYWGPAESNPLILGNNAEGYPHFLLGTSRPLNVGIGLVHGRMVWGRLEQSDYSPMPDPDALRFMSGFVGLFRPRGVPGLEIGMSRFFHSPWPEGGFSLDDFTKPLEGFLKVNVRGDEGSTDNSDADNQLASVFMRWALPRIGFEAYAEYAREDHNWDFRDFMLEPDHDAAYLLGFRRVWAGDGRHWTVLRGEVMNAEVSHLFRVRTQTRFYRHGRMRQGHTFEGQILGSQHGYGGAATELAVDRYEPWGRWTLAWNRAVYDRRGRYWQEGLIERDAVDTGHALRAEALWFHGELELFGRLEGLYRLNHYFEDDDVNLHAAFGVTWRP
ncbi:MAG TPA: capsule assembly Wzi family protein [Longimicrobiaceae bacterium]